MAVFNFNQPNLGRPEFLQALFAIRADLKKIRDAYALLVAKLDADAGVTDTDYAATVAPAATEFVP